MKRFKRVGCFVLALSMLIGLLPMRTCAVEADSNGLPLEGLNVLCLGDSITAGQGLTTDTRWTNVLASKYGWTLTNKSQGGISLSSYYYTANGTTDVSIAKKAEVLKTMTTKPNVIIVWGGHNDTGYRASPLGTWDDVTTDSFKGALKYIASLAEEYAPDATLFVLTPLWNNEKCSTLKVPENTTDNNWMFVDAIYEGAEKYGWIPINMDLCGITPYTKSEFLLDNIHPNEAGTEKIVEYLSEELANYGQNSKKQAIILNQASASLEIGKRTTIKVALTPRSGNGTPAFTWSSSNTSVAAVDSNGVITAVAHGNAIITATADSGASASVRVSVAEGAHTYTPTVTAPTCTERGYTTYTCTCGDSYVADYVNTMGHCNDRIVCTVCGNKYPDEITELGSDLAVTITPENYLTISNPFTEELACGPNLVTYGNGKFAVAYLADDVNTVETESSTTIVCRLGLFDVNTPENGTFFDIATAGQTIGNVTIGSKAPYEPNLLKLSDDALLVLFNIRDTAGNYVYYSATFDIATNTVTSYQPLTLDGKNWTPANIAASYNTLAENDISTSGPASSMVFTSRIIQHEGYYYGYCGGICSGFGGMLVRSTDGVNWTSVMAPEALSEMKGVIECGFEFLEDYVYFCMRDISSGVYHCSYDFKTGERLTKTSKLSGITTSKPTAFTQNGNLYLIVNKATGDDNTVGRRNTALFYQVNPESCRLALVRQVFCADGIAYHSVVNYNGINYWSFHTDARRINPYTQGRSNLAFLQIPELYAAESDSADGVLNLNDYSYMFGRGCITGASNTWQAGAVNMHYQIPLADFVDFDTVTITANNEQKAYIAFFTKRMTQNGAIAYADGWTEQLIMEPGTVQTLNIPEDAAYLYILNNNAAGANLLPDSVVFSKMESEQHTHSYESIVTAPTCTEQGYTTYTCACGDSYVGDYVEATGHKRTNGICCVCGDSFAGKKVSILSHSMSTYAGVSNNTSSNSTIGKNDVYYTEGRHGVYLKDTWWMQTIDALGMELLVNNSWSGSCIFQPRKGEASVGYGDRAVNLHNDHTGEEPDIIFVYLGCNDFAYFKDTFGTADSVDYETIILDNGDGTYTYAQPTNACEAYAIMLHKVRTRYPQAEIYCMTSTARREIDYAEDNRPDAGQPTAYVAHLHQIAEHFGFPVVDLENAIPKDVEIFDKYMGDKRAHANELGMDRITNAVLSVMLGKEAEICHVTADHGAVTEQAVLLGGSYNAKVNIPQGYSVVVTMGGKDITADAYTDGRIVIAEVTGDIHVETVINRDPRNFRWEFQNGILTSVGSSENVLTKLSGTVANNILNDGIFQLNTPVVLKHDLPWAVEWKCAEDWRGAVLVSHKESATKAMTFLTRTKGGQLCFGTYTGSQYDNYGIDISYLDSKTHSYRLENRIAEDGSNMVWLYLDGVEIGPMNNYFIGSKDQNTTSDWVSGKDFVFSFIGMTGHALRNCQLDYLSVTECDHTYDNGICTVCGSEHPEAADYAGKVISILGDSISTFAGYIPVADGFNLEHLARYPQDNLLTDVNETWWMQVICDLDAKLGINDSWRGATVSGAAPVTTGTTGENAAMGNLTRIQNLGSNGTPDVILFYGGTNDLAHVSKVGSFDPDAAPDKVDLTTKKWDNLADGYVHTLLRLQHYYPETVIVALLPTYTTSYYSSEKLAQGNAVLAAICEHYGVAYVDLRECGITTADLPDGVHPNANGMDCITEAVLETLFDECKMEPGENVVHSVTHNLTGAESSLGYYKGVSHGKPFVTTLIGENLTVTVTMGGENITDTCWADGTVSIFEVTGDVVITAVGEEKPVYADHLQQLPENICAGTNLWAALEHDTEYYTVDGWGVHPSGKVDSVTIPVNPVDRIWATSFQAGGTNGSTVSGIRITWFGETGVLETVSPDRVYAEFAANGCLTAPEGAVAVNIPMWDRSEENAIYLLSRAHDYESVVTAPTCTEQGYTTYTCGVCGDSYVDSYMDANGHSYAARITYPDGMTKGHTDYICEECGDTYQTPWLDPSAYAGMTIAAVGDSITAGVGVTADETDYVTILARQLGMEYVRLGRSGTTLCTGGHRTCNIGQLTEAKLQGADVVTILMGINDYDQAKEGYYALGDINSTDTSTIYGAMRMWCEKIEELRKVESLAQTQFCFVTPVITSWNDSVTSARDWDQSKTTIHGYTLRDLCNAIIEVAVLYDVPVIDLNLISGMYYVSGEDNNVSEFGGDGVHPGENGHALMASALASALLQNDLRDDHEHSYGSWITTDWPNCLEAGEEQRVCSVCTTTERRIKDALGHSYDSVVTAPTCTEQGYTTHTCAGCGDSYMDAYVDALGHAFSDWFETKAPTCTEVGEERRDCERCEHFETREVAVAGHDYESVVTAPTCTEQGYTTHTCAVCGESYVDSYVAALGHPFGDWAQTKAPTCTEAGEERRDCERCDHYETREVAAAGHDYKSVVTKPTCTEQGYTTHTCTCGDSYVDGYVDARGHSFGEWVETKAPTCTEAGEEKRDCDRCDHFETREVAALGHAFTHYEEAEGLLIAHCDYDCGLADEKIGTPSWRVENGELKGTEYTTDLVLIALYSESGRLIAVQFCERVEWKTVDGTMIYRYTAPEFAGAQLAQAGKILCFNLTEYYVPIRDVVEVKKLL